MYNPMDLTGKTIMVTGASSGIGASCAGTLSRLGANIVLVGRSEERLQQVCTTLEGDGHNFFSFDLTKTEEIPDWLKKVAGESGPFDGLVHSAGVLITKPVRAIKISDYRELMTVNLDAAFALAKGYQKRGVANKPASLVFISSIAGMFGMPALSAYSASKSALIGLARSLATELAREDIRVNSVSPGYIATAMTDANSSILTGDQLQAINDMHPLGIGQPEHVGNAVAFLLAESGRWITGTNLVVDGGRSCC